jgi:hypothetical protein
MSGASEVQPSLLQQDVAATLRALNVSITEEVLDRATGELVTAAHVHTCAQQNAPPHA